MVKDTIIPDDPLFSEWYALYPRKDAKGAARLAFRRALKKASVEEIMEGTRRYAAYVAGKERRFVCLPATFLNGERWADETPTATRSDSALGEATWLSLTHATWEAIFKLYRRSGVWRAPAPCGPPGALAYVGPTDLLRSDELAEMERLKRPPE
jgi:hypothetical protein